MTYTRAGIKHPDTRAKQGGWHTSGHGTPRNGLEVAMRKWLKWMGLILLAGAVGLALSVAGSAGLIVSMLAYLLSSWFAPEVERVSWVNYAA